MRTPAPAIGLSLVAGLAGVLGFSTPSQACRVVDLELTPTSGLQIVIWLEDKDGNFVDTLFITQATGSYGLGNRPGIMEFNSEFLWPYGRRVSVFPVWAHRHGTTYPLIVFQDGRDRDLSHAFTQSSLEPFYCRPMKKDESALQNSIDANSCATMAFTDKGRFADSGTALYPPRSDVTFTDGTDSPEVKQYAKVNDVDAVSRATPTGGVVYRQPVLVRTTIPDGDYLLYVEVSKEFDENSSYAFPSPTLVAYGDYGEAYRGQPSVVWKVPITLDGTARTGSALDYEGYGDPSGADGDLRPPDATITTTTEGSGAQRLLVTTADGEAYRVKVQAQPSEETVPPGAPAEMSADVLAAGAARISFVEPDGDVRGYDIRVSPGTPITDDNFDSIRAMNVTIEPKGAGTVQTLELDGLEGQTHYWVGIRALDACLVGGSATVVDLVTPKLEGGEVSACFVATAAFGSPMQPDVSLLRSFRDQILRRQALGEIFVETYYTFGPALAGVIRPSEPLRALARAALAPLVERARGWLE